MAHQGYDYFETGKVRNYKHLHMTGVALGAAPQQYAIIRWVARYPALCVLRQ
jgi:hypothetical protein